MVTNMEHNFTSESKDPYLYGMRGNYVYFINTEMSSCITTSPILDLSPGTFLIWVWILGWIWENLDEDDGCPGRDTAQGRQHAGQHQQAEWGAGPAAEEGGCTERRKHQAEVLTSQLEEEKKSLEAVVLELRGAKKTLVLEMEEKEIEMSRSVSWARNAVQMVD
jgi:hypothetical protein